MIVISKPKAETYASERRVTSAASLVRGGETLLFDTGATAAKIVDG